MGRINTQEGNSLGGPEPLGETLQAGILKILSPGVKSSNAYLESVKLA